MISQAVQDAINEQIKHELYSAYLYLSMSAYAQSIPMPGLAHWTRLQSTEEVAHAMKLFDYVIDRGGRVTLRAIDQPPGEFRSPLDVAEQTLRHEQKVTGLIRQLYEAAAHENDYATQVELQWFISEQVEEERNAEDLLAKLKMVGDHPGALFMLDKELGARQGG